MFSTITHLTPNERRSLWVSACLAVWAGITLATLLLSRYDAMALGVPALTLVGLAFIPAFRDYRRVVCTVGASFFVGFFVIEVGLRVRLFGVDAIVSPSHYWPYSALAESGAVRPLDDPAVLYGLSPGYSGYFMGKPLRVNAEGYRQTLPAVIGAESLMVFGTSISMGAGVREDETFAHVAGDRLTQQLGRPIQGVTFGVGGYSTAQSFTLAERKLIEAPHSLRTLVVELAPGGIGDTGELAGQNVGRRTAPPISSLERYSFVLSGIYPPVNLRAKVDGIWGHFVRKAADTTMVDSPSADTRSFVERRVDDLVPLAHRNNVVLVVMVIRPMTHFDAPTAEQAGRDKLRVYCNERGVVYVDTYEAFSTLERPDDFIVFPGDLHPNARAHRRFADKLVDVLSSRLAIHEARRMP